MKKTRALVITLIAIMSLTMLTAAVHFNGGGTFTSPLDGSSKGNIGYSVDGRDSDNERVKGTLHDRGSNAAFPDGVRIRFESSNVLGGPGGSCAVTNTDYVSQDRRHAGEGFMWLDACDNDGNVSPDLLRVRIWTGPYAGYVARVFIDGGNLTAH